MRAEPITGGLFGQNLFLTSTSGEYVLRGVPHYPWQFPAERFFARLLHERTTVPVPWPYLLDPTEDIFGWSYVIMPRMPGLQLSDPNVTAGLSRSDRLRIARAMGENLARMHELTWPFAGTCDLVSDSIARADDSYNAWASSIRAMLLRSWSYSDRTTDADVEWVERLISEPSPAFDVPYESCFVLGDYKEQNATVEKRDGVWRVSGVFDLMEGRFGDGDADLSRQTGLYLEQDPSLAREFLRSYLTNSSSRPGLADRLQVYMLHDRLIIWEYCQRPGHRAFWDPELTLQGWAEPYITAVAELLAE